MTKYVIDLPNSIHHIKGFSTYAFKSEKEEFNIPVKMLKQFDDSSSEGIFKYTVKGNNGVNDDE